MVLDTSEIYPSEGPIEVNIFFFIVVYLLFAFELELNIYFSEHSIVFRVCEFAFIGLPLKIKVCSRNHLRRIPPF